MGREIILISGGLDSIVLAYHVHNQNKDIRAIYCDLGGARTLNELTPAKWVCAKLGIPLEVADLRGLNKLFIGYLPSEVIRVDGGDTVDPKPHDLIPFSKVPTGIPMMISVAMYYSHLTKASNINLAFIGSQAEHYPNLDKYVKAVTSNEALINPNFSEVSVSTPFANLDKSAVIKRGVELAAPIEISWSCIRSTTLHCGKCYACKERRNGFVSAGIEDQTIYLD